MGNKINDPIARLMGLRYKSHPWHGLEVGDDAPEVVTAFIEMVPTDTEKSNDYSGALKVYEQIEQEYPASPEGRDIEKYIERAQLKLKK